ncbi:MAG TPA: hypothetical protein PLA02_00640 [Brevefilum fermentans]|uniref:Uncharacterized protein n=1 Tax=Candidatus Brevifilum fermentans TaxID=1986204 RepID=A0A1Y6K4G9_9CHLR|nr:hypothetical protein [Chloroflexota bacterium]SMX53758.1 protein of unknown function [Brevefilum fermentans]HQA27711.1 hypothetical protein [Brevefilum fermentans]
MSQIGEVERKTQNRIVRLFQESLGHDYVGYWCDRADNINIEETYVAWQNS